MILTFPRHVHARGGIYRICLDANSYDQARAEGWVDHPPLDWPAPDVYREWDGTPIACVPSVPVPDSVPEQPKRRGRPPRVES